MQNLSDIEKEILQRKTYGLGNDILYTLCKKKPFCWEGDDKYTATDALAAQMWLIGRSYAASPERRSYYPKKRWKKIDKNDYIKFSNSGNGLDTYFGTLADKLLEENFRYKLKEIFDTLNKRKDYKYKFEDEQSDKKMLETVITAVLNLNALIKEARYDIDKDDIDRYAKNHGKTADALKDNQTNLISFCSKFLHFHFPDQVFIMDSITKEHFKVKDKTTYYFNFKNEESEIQINKGEVSDYKKELQIKEPNDKEEEYVRHCVREYLLAKAIHNKAKFDFGDKYIPRLIDTYMLIANSYGVS